MAVNAKEGSKKELMELDLLKIKGLVERLERHVDNYITCLADGTLIPIEKDAANKLIKDCKDIMMEIYDDFIEEEDEVIIGPKPA